MSWSIETEWLDDPLAWIRVRLFYWRRELQATRKVRRAFRGPKQEQFSLMESEVLL